jgi:DNA-binding transcriptional LysR family regulator
MQSMTEPHGFELDDLRVLRAVAAMGSFTGAAASLHYTQSGVSRRVAQIERAAGGPVFVRLPRGVRPTALGELLLSHADELLRRVDVLAADLAAERAGVGGHLRVGSFATANACLMPATLNQFRSAAPDVAITVEEGLSVALMRQLGVGSLDVAVVSDYPTGSLDEDGAELIHLLDDPLLVAIPPAHALAAARDVRLTDLAGENWISARPEDVDTVLAVAAARAEFRPRLSIHVASWTAKLSYVAAGLGVTIVPGLLARAVPPKVVLKPLGDELPPRRVFAALPPHPTSAARSFVDHLCNEVGGAGLQVGLPHGVRSVSRRGFGGRPARRPGPGPRAPRHADPR